jgi:four helix bundle protein
MFDFEKLDVYQAAKSVHKDVMALLKKTVLIETSYRNQLRRASLSVILNLAEGSGKQTPADKKNFYYTARGSLYECVALFDAITNEEIISELEHREYYLRYEKISKMLFGLIQSVV